MFIRKTVFKGEVVVPLSYLSKIPNMPLHKRQV